MVRAAGAVTISLGDGRRLERHCDSGMLEANELADKWLRLTRDALGEPGAAALYDRLQRLEDATSLEWLTGRPDPD